MSGFTYGNGIVHSLTQNTRFLPLRSKDMNGAIAILDDTYAFDANGNVASITDGTVGNGGSRSMSYDDADRLIQTDAPNQWWLTNTITYDALDNIRVNTLGNRTHNYQYNATSQRLDQLTLPDASVARNLDYDAAGNVTTNGAQSYVFDKANRLANVVGIESYEYDGHGRRVKSTRFVGKNTNHSMYSLDGKLITEEDARSGKNTDYIYLNGSLVAKRSAPFGTSTYTVSYQHTDSLGSPVAESDASKTVTKIERYTPYGEPSDQGYDQGPGYTGHVTDAATGLTYAQQRYYDPVIGRFLSADPVETDPNTGASFNRYRYANNNPYRYTDPDGRVAKGFREMFGRYIGARIEGKTHEEALAQEKPIAEMKLKTAEVIIDTSAIGGAKAAVEITTKLASGEEPLGQATGSLTGDVVSTVTETVLDKKIGNDLAHTAGALAGEVVGRATESKIDKAVKNNAEPNTKKDAAPPLQIRSTKVYHEKDQ